ncbi:hypothetical protein [Paenibacillus prosopidis]|uniref:Uncharacterized protein n=1 Tax=Paenibacillus prosopidis TaxID=630520 RepID=A0A368W6R2_9BACL|nr:hypothetical protein [Paenibacillus prosopidis]RCW51670.1 hypothetical protein DFP97_10110 [Paenibacillus prosopidis]
MRTFRLVPLVFAVLLIISVLLNLFQWKLNNEQSDRITNVLGESVASGRGHLIETMVNLDNAIKGEQTVMSLRETSSNMDATYRILEPTVHLHPKYSNEWLEIKKTLFDISHSQTLRKIEAAYQAEGVLTSEQKDILKQILFFLTEVRESLEAPSIRILVGGDPDFYIPSEAIQRAFRAANTIQEFLQSKQ